MPPISRRHYEMGMRALLTAVHCCCCCCISAPRRSPFQSIDMGLRHCTGCSGFPTLARAQREVALLALAQREVAQRARAWFPATRSARRSSASPATYLDVSIVGRVPIGIPTKIVFVNPGNCTEADSTADTRVSCYLTHRKRSAQVDWSRLSRVSRLPHSRRAV